MIFLNQCRFELIFNLFIFWLQATVSLESDIIFLIAKWKVDFFVLLPTYFTAQ